MAADIENAIFLELGGASFQQGKESRQPFVILYSVHVQVTRDVPVRPCAVAVIVAVSVPPPQVKLQITVVVFARSFPGATHAALVAH
jgi:hypothetical protein